MGGDSIGIPLLRKLVARNTLPIQIGDWDDDFYFVAHTTLEGDGVAESH